MMSAQGVHQCDRLGHYTPKFNDIKELRAGEVGVMIASIKNIFGAPVGDTITHFKNGASEPLAGFQHIKPQVYAVYFL